MKQRKNKEKTKKNHRENSIHEKLFMM